MTSGTAQLFPNGCTCLSYGRGLTMTRVNSPYCPIHVSLSTPSITKGRAFGAGIFTLIVLRKTKRK